MFELLENWDCSVLPAVMNTAVLLLCVVCVCVYGGHSTNCWEGLGLAVSLRVKEGPLRVSQLWFPW